MGRLSRRYLSTHRPAFECPARSFPIDQGSLNASAITTNRAHCFLHLVRMSARNPCERYQFPELAISRFGGYIQRSIYFSMYSLISLGASQRPSRMQMGTSYEDCLLRIAHIRGSMRKKYAFGAHRFAAYPFKHELAGSRIQTIPLPEFPPLFPPSFLLRIF